MSARGLFLRTVVVEAGAPGTQGRRFEGLRTAFTVEHRAGGAPSRARFDLYNVGEQAIPFVKPRANKVALKVGYDGDEKLLFRGNPMRDGVLLQAAGNGDRVISVDASDGGAGFDKHIVKSYRRDVMTSALLDEILSSTGWDEGQIDVPRNAVLSSGPTTLNAKPDEILDRIGEILLGTDPRGYDWTVTDNALHIIRRGGTRRGEGILISQREGNLIGTPTATRTGCRVRALIDPVMRPLMPFRVQSDLVMGDFMATEITFSGDNWGNDFYMDITGKTIRRTP